MNTTVSELKLQSFSKFIAKQMGLHFPKERFCDLERELNSLAKELNFLNIDSCIEWFMSSELDKNQLEILACHFTVGETYFFREQATFDALKLLVFPELINYCKKIGKTLTIWSAGCCSGEEPYSLAILLTEMVNNIVASDVSIIATDINPDFLNKASEGIYSNWSFRNTPFWIKEKYFEKNKEGRFKLSDKIKSFVKFSASNLVDISTLPIIKYNTIDIILCRNVLMYFTQEQMQEVIKYFYLFLRDGGWLIVSPSELSSSMFSSFTTVNHSGAILYKKANSIYQETEKFFLPNLPHITSKLETSPISTVNEIESITPVTIENLDIQESESFKENNDETSRFTKEIYYIKAIKFYKQGLYEAAIDILLKCLFLDNNNIEALILLAKAYTNQGNYDKALQACQKAIVMNKLDASCYYLLSSILQEQNKTQEAINSLKKAIYVDPNFILAHFSLATLYLQQANYKESNKHFENALSLLRTYKQEETLPYSEGITAGRLIEIIKSMSVK